MLLALILGAGLPLVDAALADEPAPLCGKDRCCCATGAAAADDRPCLRRSCGCGQPEASAPLAPLRTEAVLAATAPSWSLPAADCPADLARCAPLRRPQPPLVPPPRPRSPRPAFS